MEKNEQDQGIFYGIGKGVFLAVLLFAVPGFLVLQFYDRIESTVSDVADLPVYDQMQDNFKSGADVIGILFAEKLRRFYQPDSLTSFIKPNNGALPKNRPAYWERAALEQQLSRNLSSAKQASMLAYLDYIEKYRVVALEEMRRTKIPASVTLAQGLFEGNAGRGYLAANANNHFGVKCRLKNGYRRDGSITNEDFDYHSLAIGCVQRTDDYVWDRFEIYPSARESFRRHSLLLQGERYNWMIREYEIGEVYPIARKLYGHDRVPYYAAWSVGLKQSGYATAKHYPEMITMIIETYQLWKIDYELLMV